MQHLNQMDEFPELADTYLFFPQRLRPDITGKNIKNM